MKPKYKKTSYGWWLVKHLGYKCQARTKKQGVEYCEMLYKNGELGKEYTHLVLGGNK